MLNIIMDKFKKHNSTLDSLFYPKSIAIIGASNNKEKIGGFIFSQIKELNGITSYPINVKFKQIQETLAYTNVLEINSNIDLAIIAIPKNFVLGAINDCIKANIKNLVIISAGFKETGEEGKQEEEEIRKLVKIHNLNLIGPNCLGILNAETNMNCSFAAECPQAGEVALISQSGAVIDAIIDWSFTSKIGFSKIVSLGNMAGIDSNTILEYLKDDPKTKAIVFYMETIENGEKFAKILKETSKKKPVIIIKPGNSAEAQKAIGSHTGSLAQDNILVKTLIEQNNGIFIESLNELYNLLKGLKANLPTNNDLTIITNAGGLGVIATDSASKHDFKLYEFTQEQKLLFDFLPQAASINNPIDILGDARSQRYEQTLNLINQNIAINNILVLLTPQIMTDCTNVAKAIENITKNTKKTIYTCFLGGKQIHESLQYLDEKNIPSFQTPSDALLTLKQLHTYNNFKYIEEEPNYEFNQDEINKIKEKLKDKSGLLDYNLTKEIIKIFKINLPEKIIIADIDEVLNTQINENKTYVIKVDSPDIIHKKDVGGIQTNITFENFHDIAIEMFETISKITNNFTLNVEEQVSGHEIILGLKQEKGLSNFIMFGMGGTFVDLYGDANFALCPLNKNNVTSFIQKSKAYKILNGFRGGEKINFVHLNEILIRLSHLQEIFPQIKEADFNPIICSTDGIYLVDVKLIL